VGFLKNMLLKDQTNPVEKKESFKQKKQSYKKPEVINRKN